MAKKRRRIISSKELSRRAAAGRKISAKRKGRKLSRETKHKMRLYRGIVRDYVNKQNLSGEKISYNQARSSNKVKKILHDLKSNDKEKKLQALKDLGRRDNIPDFVPIGESATFQTEIAA